MEISGNTKALKANARLAFPINTSTDRGAVDAVQLLLIPQDFSVTHNSIIPHRESNYIVVVRIRSGNESGEYLKGSNKLCY